jgi:hypothetical protein
MWVFASLMTGLTNENPVNKTISIGATYLKAHRTASSLELKKGERGRRIWQKKRGRNTKLHAITDNSDRPIRLVITAGQISD